MTLTEELKQAILLSAISGKLTMQNSKFENAQQIVDSIRERDSQTLKREKVIPAVSADELPFDIPDNWRWVRLSGLSENLSDGIHGTPAFDASGDYFFINGNNLVNGKIVMKNDTQRVCESEYLKYKKPLTCNTVLLSINGTIGNTAFYNGEPVILGKSACYIALHPEINKEYFRLILETRFFLLYGATKASQTTIKNLSLKAMRLFPVPVPPIDEQQRIVDRVNVLMEKLDEFSEIEQQLLALKANFPADLRGAILQAAMQGKLTEQLESDSSVSFALEQAKAEKELLQLKKETRYPDISDEEIPYDLPDNWQWVRLREIVYNREQKTPSNTFSYIDIGSIDNVHQQLNSTETIMEASKASSRARKVVQKGDVIYATVRPYLHNLCIIDREFSHEPIASTGFATMVCHSCIMNRYLLYYLMAPVWDKYANATDNAKGVAYPAINDKKLYAGLIPLPPIEEQQRIVERLDALLPLCDTLV